MNYQETSQLVNVAQGREPADVYIENGKLLCVYSGEILEGYNLAIRGSRVAYIGSSRDMVGSGTMVIDAGGQYLSPGYIDAHGHVDLIANPLAVSRAVIPRGTTAILSDTHEMGGALGSDGIKFMLEITENLPLKYYFALTVANPPHPEIEGGDCISEQDFLDFLSHPRVLAVSEITAWKRLTELDGPLLAKIANASSRGKRVEGHSSGCSLEKLNALVDAGITSCHESVTVEDVLMRLRLGIYTMLRHGSIRKELETLAPCFTSNESPDTGRVILTPDWMSPQDIKNNGYMDYVIKEAIRNGIPTIKAYQTATINPAVYLGLDMEIGGIAPGRFADILFIERLEEPAPARVMVNGRMMAEKGGLLENIPGRCPTIGPHGWRTGRPRKFGAQPGEFRVAASRRGTGEETVPALHILNDTITTIKDVTLEESGGFLEPRRGDVLKISMVGPLGGFVTVFLTGFGSFSGALATSIAHDHHSPYVLGRDESDMALAFNRVMEMGGGYTLAEGGKIVAQCPLSVGGVMSHRDIPELAGELDNLENHLGKLGCTLEKPMVTLGFISFSGLPTARITPKGLYNVKSGQIVYPRP
ncbi:MAG: hypothetical protein VR68_06555 [Peptococcaceae bacterium BRH_c4a]|nr:MAG: hypothetical protein VR68_06555 [Peptococcaceae bacterium BRH_c4a]